MYGPQKKLRYWYCLVWVIWFVFYLVEVASTKWYEITIVKINPNVQLPTMQQCLETETIKFLSNNDYRYCRHNRVNGEWTWTSSHKGLKSIIPIHGKWKHFWPRHLRWFVRERNFIGLFRYFWLGVPVRGK